MLKLLPEWLKIGGSVAAGLIIGSAAGAALGTWHGKSLARADIAAEESKAALDRITNLEKSNANFRSLPAHDRCLVFMRDSGLSESECGDQR